MALNVNFEWPRMKHGAETARQDQVGPNKERAVGGWGVGQPRRRLGLGLLRRPRARVGARGGRPGAPRGRVGTLAGQRARTF